MTKTKRAAEDGTQLTEIAMRDTVSDENDNSRMRTTALYVREDIGTVVSRYRSSFQ